MIRKLLLSFLIAFVVFSAPSNDKMKIVPGYPNDYNTSIYAGYLSLKSQQKQAYYVFVESINGPNNNDPVTLWLNGGPGCSSLIGFLQQIGPYYIEDGKNYKQGDNLTKNQYSWHRYSNLLFIQSPAGVGYSYNTNKDFVYNDVITAHDNLNALLDFFEKFSQYKRSRFFIAGQSYAGKYIPDLAVLIDQYNLNAVSPINFKGFLIGNGVMSFDTLKDSEITYMMDRSFVNPQIQTYYNYGCQIDPDSAGCRYFTIKFQEDIDEINVYNVYSYCYYNDSFLQPQKRPHITQQSILTNLKRKYSNGTFKEGAEKSYNDAPCAYFDGMFNYFNIHEIQYKAKFQGQKWNGPCAGNLSYTINPSGSMESYKYLLARIVQKPYVIHLYNGNWDVVVPYHDTIENIKRLNLIESYVYTPWFVNDQHAGFHQLYSGLVLTIVKGASHMVPQSKRAQALDLFNSTIQGNKALFQYLKQ